MKHYRRRFLLKPVTEFKYNFNNEILWQEYTRLKEQPDPKYNFYVDGEEKSFTMPGFRVLGSQTYGEDTDSELIKQAGEFVKYFNIDDEYIALFLWMDKGFHLPWHVDDVNGCQSNINYVMSDNPEPVEFRDGKHKYKLAALDVMQEHQVCNSEHERIIMRISFKTLKYGELVDCISNRHYV